MVIGTYADNEGALADALRLIRSLRHFGGRYSESVVFICVPSKLLGSADGIRQHNTEILECSAPEEFAWLPYSAKPFAAALFESHTESQPETAVWMDADTIILDEPSELTLGSECELAYCPVMHNRSGALYAHAPNEYWRRIYEVFELDDNLLFPMTTPADQQAIRAYFHVGLIAVRPARRILRQWACDFMLLAGDPKLQSLCREDRTRAVFLHQTAFTGAALQTIPKSSMRELSARYNFPVLFHRQYASVHTFDSIENVVTARVVISLGQLGPDWCGELKGPRDKIEWLKQNVSAQT